MSSTFCLPESLKTSRLALRRARPGHAEAIYKAYASDPEVTRYLAWRTHDSMDDPRGFLESCEREWNAGTGFPFVIFLRDSPEELVGMVHPQITPHGLCFGYVLGQVHWGQGYAGEALTALVDAAFEHPTIFRAYAFCDAGNLDSTRVMEKAGMSREGLLRRYFRHPNISEEPRDCWMYARVR